MRQVNQVPAGEFPAARGSRFMFEAEQEMDGIVADFIGRDFRFEVKGAEATVAAAGGIEFWVEVEHALGRAFYQAQGPDNLNAGRVPRPCAESRS